MKRYTVLLFSCLALAASAWLGHVVLGQTADTKPAEKTFNITQTQLDTYVAKKVAEDREKSSRGGPATDEQVLNPQNWHKAIFNKAEYVVYTGPGQVMFHHWAGAEAVTRPPAPKGGAAVAPATKGN